MAARKGIIYQKLRYGKTKSKLQSESDPKRIRHENGSDGSETEQSENETTLISFLQSCVLPEDLPRIKQKFEETVQLRRKMMIEIDKYEQLLDLYLASPELVKLINTNVFFLLKLWLNKYNIAVFVSPTDFVWLSNSIFIGQQRCVTVCLANRQEKSCFVEGHENQWQWFKVVQEMPKHYHFHEATETNDDG